VHNLPKQAHCNSILECEEMQLNWRLDTYNLKISTAFHKHIVASCLNNATNALLLHYTLSLDI